MSFGREPERAGVRALLVRVGLPAGDLAELDLRHFLFAGPKAKPIGLVGLQIEPPHALLRSLAVDPASRGEGIGSRLVAHAEEHARLLGVTSLYLLTTTAETFFQARGYARIDRDDAPYFIRATAEFAELCPSTSAFMRKTVAG
jgi:amino-acid N-acetyltransferase